MSKNMGSWLALPDDSNASMVAHNYNEDLALSLFNPIPYTNCRKLTFINSFQRVLTKWERYMMHCAGTVTFYINSRMRHKVFTVFLR